MCDAARPTLQKHPSHPREATLKNHSIDDMLEDHAKPRRAGILCDFATLRETIWDDVLFASPLSAHLRMRGRSGFFFSAAEYARQQAAPRVRLAELVPRGFKLGGQALIFALHHFCQPGQHL